MVPAQRGAAYQPMDKDVRAKKRSGHVIVELFDCRRGWTPNSSACPIFSRGPTSTGSHAAEDVTLNRIPSAIRLDGAYRVPGSDCSAAALAAELDETGPRQDLDRKTQ